MAEGTSVPAGWPMFLHGWVPGLWHLRAGDCRRAALAFVSCAVVFFAGYAIVQDRLFYYALVSFDRDSVLATIARVVPLLNLPEVLNLPCTAIGTMAAYQPGFEAERLWRMPRDLEHIGSFLTGASGMLAAFWAADAQWRGRLMRAAVESRSPTNPALAAGLSWLVPGLGHWRAGQRDKGVLMGVAVVLVFAFALLVSQGHAVDRGTQPIWWIGQNLFGGGTLVAALTTAPLQFDGYPTYHDLGVVLATVAGLMNLVVMVDAYTVCERATFPAASQQPEASA